MEPVPQSEPVAAPATAPVAVKAVWPSAYSLLKQALVHYKAHSSRFMMLGLVPFVLAAVTSLLALYAESSSQTTAIIILVVFIVLTAAAAVVGVANQMAVIKSIEAFEKNEDLGVKDAYKFGFGIFLSTVWIGILTMLVVWGGFLALIIPGIFLSIYLSLVYFTLALENKKGMDALAQSILYVKKHASQVFGKFFYLGLVSIGVYFIIMALASLVSALVTGDMASVFVALSEKAPMSNVKAAYGIVSDFLTFTVFLPIMFSYYYFIYKYARSLRAASPITEAETAKTKKTLVIWGIVGIFTIIILAFLFLLANSFGLSGQ